MGNQFTCLYDFHDTTLRAWIMKYVSKIPAHIPNTLLVVQSKRFMNHYAMDVLCSYVPAGFGCIICSHAYLYDSLPQKETSLVSTFFPNI
jgi:hypothetical protein